jgi:hypothetical protein
MAVRHSATAMLRLAPRADEIAADLRLIVPAASEADEPTIRLLALVLARIEAANEWVAEHGIFRNGKGEPQPILKVLSTWENTAGRLLDRLGGTPTSRAQLGLDLARAEDVLEHGLREGRRLRLQAERQP